MDAADQLMADTAGGPAPRSSGSVLDGLPADPQAFNFRAASMVRRLLDDAAKRQQQFGTVGPIVGPAPTVGSVARGVITDLVAGGKNARAGINQMAGDIMGSERLQAMSRKERGQADLMTAVSTPEFESDTARGIYSGLSSTVRQLPALAAAVATRNPNVALGGMVAPMLPDEYGKFRQRGGSPLESLAGAAGSTATEYITEKLPMGFLVKQFGRAGAGQFLTGILAREVPGEQVATIVQDAIDTAVANPDKTWGDYLAERPGAAYQTLLATLTQSGIMGGANAVATRLTGQQQPPEPTLPDYQEAARRVFGRTTPPAPVPAQAPAPTTPPEAEVVNRILQAIEQTQNVQNVPPAQRAETQAPPAEATAPARSDAATPIGVPAEPAAADVEADGLTFDDLVPATTGAAPVTAEAQAATTEPVTQPAQPTGEGAGASRPTQDAPILQNRNRATPSSIAQMQSIAGNPDYGRLGFSRDFANGAPVVAGGQVAPEQLGRQDVAVASDGRRIPVQYAVVEAADVLPSNRADGTPNADYGNQAVQRIRAIAGNGRIAGLQQAYSKGTTAGYANELASDTLHGVSPDVIRRMRAPVLVRVMPTEQVTTDIGDVSNTVGNLNLSPVEQANNDAQRVNLEALQFAEDGSITPEAVRQFVRAMPQAEQGGLIDTNGQPTKQAVDRINAAVFARAYGNDQLIRLFAQAQDPEARNVMSALAQVAPKMARLEGAGALDIRDIVTQAAEIAVNARREGKPMKLAAQQLDMAADPDVAVILDLFAANPRSVKPVVEALSRAADAAYTEANKPAEDMFGEVPRAGRQDIINQLRPQDERASQETLEDPAGRGTAGQDAQGPAAEPARPAAPAEAQAGRPAEEEGLTSYTQADIEQRLERLEQAQREQAQQDREAEQRAQADAERDDFTLTGSDRAADANPNQGDIFARERGATYSDERDLIVTHNLTAENLLHAVKMGGIPVPSLAVTKKDSPLTGFGEITLIGNKALADPKGYAGTKVFGADIYSPRYPNVERDIDRKAQAALQKRIKPVADQMGESALLGSSELERNGQRTLERNLAVMGTFLREQGVEPQIVMRKGMDDARRARLERFGMAPFMDAKSAYDLQDDPAFVAAAVAEARDAYEQTGKRDAMVKKLDTDNEFQRNIARDTANAIVNDARLRAKPEADRYSTLAAMEKQIADAGMESAYQQWVQTELQALTKSERIFQGFTNSGNRKYIPHTLENVVKLLKKELRGGESFNYGVGSLRAKFTPQFKSIEQIRKAKGRLVSKADFKKVKAEIDTQFWDVARAINPDLSGDTAIAILEDAAKMGVQRAAKGYGYDVSGETAVQVAEFLTRLRELPTEYFEAKVLREVDLAEFKGAVVPEGVRPDVIEALKARGVNNIRTYKKGDDASRSAAVRSLAEEMQQAGAETVFQPNAAYNAEASRRPYTDDRQLQLFLDNGPVESQAGPRGEAAQREAVAAVDDLRSTETVLGLALSRDYAARQRVSLVGQKVSNPEDLAVLAQVYRDPRFETLRVVFVNDAGKVVSQVGLTSRLPAAAPGIMGNDLNEYLDGLMATARNQGASGYYMLHNHPSGIAKTSRADESLTRTYAARTAFGDVKFRGHVVIDTNEYSVIDSQGESTLFKKDFGQPASYEAGEWEGVSISGPADVMMVAKRLQLDDGAVTLVMTTNQFKVMGVTTIPRSAVSDDINATRRNVVRATMRQRGVRVFAVSRDMQALQQLGDLAVDSIHVESSGRVASLGERGIINAGIGRLYPEDRRARLSPDTSPEFAYLRQQSQPADARRVTEPDVEQTSPNRDALGRVKFRLGEVALGKLDAATRPLQEKFGMRMASPELRRQLRQMKATIEEAKRKAVDVAKEMGAMPEADRAMVSDIVEKMIAPGAVPPEHAVRVADAITRTMDQQTDELVALGMLSADSAERWRGRYLPRIYNRQTELADDPLIKRLFKTGTPTMAGIGGGSLKGRGLFQDVSVDAVDQWLAMGYEVRDPHWTMNQGKLELKDPNTPQVAREQVTVWRDWTPSERAQMGENRDALYRFVQGYTAMQRDIALGRLFNSIANNTEWVRRSGAEGWVQVPTSEIPDTGGVKRYGNLAGLWVRQDVMSHLTQFEEAANDTLQLYREALGLWKEGKTALNPVAHFNNVMSNVSMAHFAGVSYWDGHKYAAAVRDLVNDAPMVDEARKVGLFTGSFTKEEMVQAMPPELQQLMQMDEGRARKAGKQVMNALTFWLRKPLRDAYEFEDSFFKYLIYRDARQQGMEPAEAMDYALRYIFTYDDLPSGARKVRDFAIPFFSWTYKAAPALLHTAMVYPWRFLAPAAALHGINLVAYALAAGDEDDNWLEKIAKGRDLEREEREAMPERTAGTGMLLNPKTIRLGTDSVTGNPVFLDVSRVVPGGDMFDMVNQAGGLPLPAPLMPNHPVLSAFSAMIANREMFMGRDVTDKNDTAGEAAEKRAKWMAGFLLPAVAPGGYHSQRIADAAANAMDTVIETPLGDFTGVDRSGLPVQPKYAAMQTVGIKARPVDLELEAQRKRAQEAALINSIAAEVRSMARLYQRGAVSDRMMEQTREKAREKIERTRED
jgi:hypothetical protein